MIKDIDRRRARRGRLGSWAIVPKRRSSRLGRLAAWNIVLKAKAIVTGPRQAEVGSATTQHIIPRQFITLVQI